MLTIKEYYDVDPANRGENWANSKISHFRNYWQPLVSSARARENMQYLLGEQSMENVKKMFTDATKANIDFTPTNPMEKIRNILVAEIENANVRLSVNANDPTALAQKKRDRELLANRSDMETFLSAYARKAGLPDFKLADEQDQINGNIEKFDELGLEEDSQEDLDHFFATYHRLRHEIMAENAINYYLKYNEVHTMLPIYCNDILAKKAIASKVYVNRITGAIDIKYLAPENVWAIMNKRMDGKDATCKGYQENVTVAEFLDILGDKFNWETDFQYLLTAVNFANNQKYTGVGTDNSFVQYGTAGRLCSAGEFHQYKITLGYIEWVQNDATTYKLTKKNRQGNPGLRKASPSYAGSPDSKYERNTTYDLITYKSFFIPTAINAQKLFDYGKLSYENNDKYSDEYTPGGVIFQKYIGKSAIEIAKKHIDKLNKAAAKHEYLINKAKAPGRLYNIDALMTVAEKMIKSGNAKSDIMETIELFSKTENELYTALTIDGQSMGGNGVPHFDLKNGISEAVSEFRTIMMECIDDIASDLGITPQRQAEAPAPREVVALNMEANASSRNATQYMNRMLMGMFTNVGIKVTCYTQQIVRFRKVNPRPYEFMRTALGDKGVEDIRSLDNIPLHRYGNFVEPFNIKYDQREQKMYADIAYQRGEIEMHQILLVNTIENPKQAAMVLAYEKRRNERNKMKAEEQKFQMMSGVEQQKHQMEMERLAFERETTWGQENIRGEWNYKAQSAGAQAGIVKQDIKAESDLAKVREQAILDNHAAQAQLPD